MKKINDQDMIDSLITFLKNRDTVLSSYPDKKKIREVYKSQIKPLLAKGTFNFPRSQVGKEEFIGSVFALSIYAKKHRVDSWKYEPKTKNGLTPDFLINHDHYLEIYCPAMNHSGSKPEYYLQVGHNGKFTRRNLITNIEEKSAKYRNEKLDIVVLVVYGEFLNDLINSLKSVELRSSKHQLFLYHGDKEIKF